MEAENRFWRWITTEQKTSLHCRLIRHLVWDKVELLTVNKKTHVREKRSTEGRSVRADCWKLETDNCSTHTNNCHFFAYPLRLAELCNFFFLKFCYSTELRMVNESTTTKILRWAIRRTIVWDYFDVRRKLRSYEDFLLINRIFLGIKCVG